MLLFPVKLFANNRDTKESLSSVKLVPGAVGLVTLVDADDDDDDCCDDDDNAGSRCPISDKL